MPPLNAETFVQMKKTNCRKGIGALLASSDADGREYEYNDRTKASLSVAHSNTASDSRQVAD